MNHEAGEFLQKVRVRERVTAKSLCRSIGFDTKVLSRIEAGTRVVKSQEAIRIIRALNMPVEDADHWLTLCGYPPLGVMEWLNGEVDLINTAIALRDPKVPEAKKDVLRSTLRAFTTSVITPSARTERNYLPAQSPKRRGSLCRECGSELIRTYQKDQLWFCPTCQRYRDTIAEKKS